MFYALPVFDQNKTLGDTMQPPQPIFKTVAGENAGLDSVNLSPAGPWAWGNSYWRGMPGGAYGLFREMEENDAHLHAVLQTRKNCLLACSYHLAPADDSAQAAALARDLEVQLRAAEGFDAALFALLDAFARGWAVAEIIWETTPNRAPRVAALIPGRPERFAFDTSGALVLLDGNPAPPSTALTTASTPRLVPRPGEFSVPYSRGARPMPARKFLTFTFQGSPANPYGTPLCGRAWWLYWLKRRGVAQWASFNERFGAPTAVARYSPATSAEEIEHLREALSSLQRDAGLIIPDGVGLELLEPRAGGASGTYRDFADWCNDELSKIVLGQTLTTGEGRRSGSLALGQVHERVRGEYLAADARALAAAISSQLLRWMTDFTAGPATPAPRMIFDTTDPAEFRAQLELDRELVKLGVALPERYFYETYRRTQPAPGERGMRYDDANLYQYHLQYGVLTVNEVRASLGMAPVAWGDRSTRDDASADSDDPRKSTTSGANLNNKSAGADRGMELDGDADEGDGAELRRERRRR
ncbi:hypothetical protein CVU37_10000 [candidate division BRC1 bacterium HGW-BRC1-1]|nr:MAG: hypothetical protein CVU37_10000 [candidate division BRC1 bacterium HGW-BRC1-1]